MMSQGGSGLFQGQGMFGPGAGKGNPGSHVVFGKGGQGQGVSGVTDGQVTRPPPGIVDPWAIGSDPWGGFNPVNIPAPPTTPSNLTSVSGIQPSRASQVFGTVPIPQSSDASRVQAGLQGCGVNSLQFGYAQNAMPGMLNVNSMNPQLGMPQVGMANVGSVPFGCTPSGLPNPGFVPQDPVFDSNQNLLNQNPMMLNPGLPGLSVPLSGSRDSQNSRASGRTEEPRDVFSRSEKWLTQPPVVKHDAWKTREEEILGVNAYVQDLVAWASQGSVEYGKEIMTAARMKGPIPWENLSSGQQTRAVRLYTILRSAFSSHGRISLLIQGFAEGLDIIPGFLKHTFESMGNTSNGFELLRQLVKEFASHGAPISDSVRLIEVAASRYLRMMGTLASEDAVGLGLSDSDLLTLLIRSLTEPCKSYVLHHSTGESYSAYRMAALRWEHRQRLFSELHHGKKLFGLNPDVDPGLEPFPNAGDDPYAIPEGPEDERWLMGLDGKGSGDTQRCSRCGKKAHSKVWILVG